MLLLVLPSLALAAEIDRFPAQAPLELAACTWFRMGKSVVWWYEPPHPLDPAAALMHLCVAPRVRGQWPVRRWHMAAQIVAELMGAERLVFAPVDGDAEMRQYAVRCGWIPDGPRMEFRLGG